METQTHVTEAARPAGPGTCALDEPAATGHEIEVPNRATLLIRGWAFAQVGLPVPKDVFLELSSERTGETEVLPAARELRTDVANHFADPGLAQSGFNARVQLGASRYGRYNVHLVQTGSAETYRMENILRFSVLPEAYESAARTGLANKFLRGHGIEIGALQRKLTPPAGCTVRYVDRMSVTDLRAHYPELNDIPIQPPDIIDDGERLALFADHSLDFVIANHFLEHCEDPLRTMHNLLRVLRPQGILYLAIPDKRTTFDKMRPCTGWSVLKGAFSSGTRPDRDHLYLEWAQLVMQQSGQEAAQMAQKLADQRYSIHFNVWDLEALLDFLWRAQSELRLPFSPAAVVSSENETILILERAF